MIYNIILVNRPNSKFYQAKIACNIEIFKHHCFESFYKQFLLLPLDDYFYVYNIFIFLHIFILLVFFKFILFALQFIYVC